MYVVMVFIGANVHATTGTGDTALTYACENGHTDVAEALLEHGAELVQVLSLSYICNFVVFPTSNMYIGSNVCISLVGA